jgi:hypothetical protein
MDEGVSLPSQPKTKAEYRAVFDSMLEEMQRLFRQMEDNRVEINRLRSRIEMKGARIDAALKELRSQVETLRETQSPHAERPA